MMRRVAGQILRAALGGRDAGLGRARLAHQLPPVVVVRLVSSWATPRETERWGGARHGEAGVLDNTDSNAFRSSTYIQSGQSHSRVDLVRGGVLHGV